MDQTHLRMAEGNAFKEATELLGQMGIEVDVAPLNRLATRDLLTFQLLSLTLRAMKAQADRIEALEAKLTEAQGNPEAETTKRTRGRKAS